MTNRKILHAADIHLDSPLQSLDRYEGAPAEEIRLASRRALTAMVDTAIDRKVDLVVIAGDLYDGDWQHMNTGLFFVKEASRLVREGIPMAVIRGNHDAANKMTASLPLPTNPDGSSILLNEKRVDLRRFDELQIAIHGRSYKTRAEVGNMAEAYPDPLPGVFNLGLLHTSLTGAEGHEPYAPCTPRQLADKQYDYWALGHIHTRGEHQVEGAAPVVFSGNIQGRHARETGAKGCIIVEVDEQNQTDRVFVPLDVVRWEVCAVDVTGMSVLDEIMDAAESWIDETLQQLNESEQDRLLAMRVRLIGESGMHANLLRNANRLESDLRSLVVQRGNGQVWLEKVRIKTTSLPDKVEERTTNMDGPIESLHEVIRGLRQQGDLDTQVDRWLTSLSNKLPPDVPRLNRPNIGNEESEWASSVLDAAAAELEGRLQNRKDSA
ncbi:MAG: DNA repair exonuclease [Planctomycetota bacterium]